MDETTNQPFQLSFNAALKIEFQGSRITSDGGLILVRELDERLGFSNLISKHIADPRGKNTQFPLPSPTTNRGDVPAGLESAAALHPYRATAGMILEQCDFVKLG